jgi:GTP cyclohydrolase I
MHPISPEIFADWIRSFGDDPEREGLKDTYRRFTESRQELFSGYHMDPKEAVTLFDSEGYDEMIICRDIDFFSTCEHHMLPFYGRAHIGYIPQEKIIGISKFARITDIFAKRLQNQERLTTQIAEFLNDTLKPHGLGVILEAEHLCIKSRGADRQNSTVTTSSFKGSFKRKPETRSEFLDLIAKSKQ